MFGVETIGPYNVSKLKDGRYSVSVNNGNFGAGICTEEQVQELRNKYNPKMDTFTKEGHADPADKPKNSKKKTALKCGIIALLAAIATFLVMRKGNVNPKQVISDNDMMAAYLDDAIINGGLL